MSEMSIQGLLEMMPGAFQAEKAAGLDTTILLHLEGEGGGSWVITIRDQKCSVAPGTIADPKMTLTASAKDCLDIFTGKLNGMAAFMQGKIRMTGDKSLALKLTSLFKM